MKKSKKFLNKILVGFIVLFVCNFLWNALISDLVPWTRTWFPSHQSYISLLRENRGFGNVYFAKEIPADSGEGEYYWHRNFVENFTAYSVVFTEVEYEKCAENRLSVYCDVLEGDEESLIYIWQDGPKCYIEETDWYNQEKLRYIEKVMQNPRNEQQYYFLVVVQDNTGSGISYTGVIMNDTTRELIEFSAEIRDGE